MGRRRIFQDRIRSFFRLLVRTSTRSAPFDLRVRPEARCNHRRPEPDCDALRPEGLAICDLQTGIPTFRSQEPDAGSLPNVAVTPRDRYYKFRRRQTTSIYPSRPSYRLTVEPAVNSAMRCDSGPPRRICAFSGVAAQHFSCAANYRPIHNDPGTNSFLEAFLGPCTTNH